jgi:hypothetical protein
MSESNYVVKDGDKWYQMNPPDAKEGDEINSPPEGWMQMSDADISDYNNSSFNLIWKHWLTINKTMNYV